MISITWKKLRKKDPMPNGTQALNKPKPAVIIASVVKIPPNTLPMEPIFCNHCSLIYSLPDTGIFLWLFIKVRLFCGSMSETKVGFIGSVFIFSSLLLKSVEKLSAR